MSAEQENSENGSNTRTRILDATEQIMLEEGYAGVSSRKVATKAGLKSKLLHYYFATMDDLFIAAFQRREDLHFAHFASAAASSKPLHDLWELGVDAASSRLYLEFNALACHRPAVRQVIARSNSRDRVAMASALQSVFLQHGIDPERYPPKGVATAMAGMARVFATDRALGTQDGHPEALAFVDRLLGCLEPLEQKHDAATVGARRETPTVENIPPSNAVAQAQSGTAGDQDVVDQ